MHWVRARALDSLDRVFAKCSAAGFAPTRFAATPCFDALLLRLLIPISLK